MRIDGNVSYELCEWLRLSHKTLGRHKARKILNVALKYNRPYEDSKVWYEWNNTSQTLYRYVDYTYKTVLDVGICFNK